jgi:hypothetical protein
MSGIIGDNLPDFSFGGVKKLFIMWLDSREISGIMKG